MFLVAVPVMAALLLLGPALLPEYRDPNAGRLDLPSVALSLLAVLPAIYGFKQIAEHGLAALPLGLVLLGLVIGLGFVRRQRRLTYPLLDLALFRSVRFSASIAAYALSCLAMFGVYIYIAQYLQLVLGLSPLHAGIATLPWALGFVAGSLLAPRLARRVAPTTILVGGLVLAAAGFGVLTLADGGQGLAVLVAATIVMSLGLAPVFTVGNEMIITAAPPKRAGAASAIAETSSEFCGALGIAIFGSIGTVVYRLLLSGTMPQGVPPGAADAAMATLGAAIASAQGLPGATGNSLAVAARAAFVDAMQLTAACGAVIVLGASVVAAYLLRDTGGVGRQPKTLEAESQARHRQCGLR